MWAKIVIHLILLKTLPGTGSLVEWTVTVFYLFILVLLTCILRTCYTKQETTFLGNSYWILYLDIWHYVSSIAIISLSNAEPPFFKIYHCSSESYCAFVSLPEESSQSLGNFSDSFVFPLQKWAKCSFEWQGLFMTKVLSMSICPQREVQLQGHVLLWMPDPAPISSNEHYVCDSCLFWAIAAWREAFVIHHITTNPRSLPSLFSK